MKRTYMRIISTLLVLISLAACSKAEPAVPSPDTGIDLRNVYTHSTAELSVDYENAEQILIANNDICKISQGGKYILTGDHKGQLWIDAQDEIVCLLLDGASLHSQSGPAIYVETAAKLILTLKDGTVNALSDSAAYKDYTDQDACLFANTDLTINGNGSLEISGYYRDAIRSKDVIKVLNGDLVIKAKKHGLRGTDGVILDKARVSLQCEDCGIITTKAKKKGKGFVAIDGSEVNIISGSTGIKVSENLYIQNALVNVTGILEDIACDGMQYVQEGCLQ